MLHRQKSKVKAVCVDILEYQGILDTTAHLEETAEMDSEVIKVIKVNLGQITSSPHPTTFQHSACFSFTIRYNNNFSITL